MINQLIADVIKKEGGYSNHPADKGGPTCFGVTQATLTSYLGRSCSATDVKLMTKKTAAAIYESLYYLKPGIDRLPELVQPILFDMAVNQGCSYAIRTLQTELQAAGYLGRIDGSTGPLTVAAAEKAAGDLGPVLINNLVRRRIQRYRDIVKADPSQKAFIRGWLARAESFRVPDNPA
jgi:lysozyme family protein